MKEKRHLVAAVIGLFSMTTLQAVTPDTEEKVIYSCDFEQGIPDDFILEDKDGLIPNSQISHLGFGEEPVSWIAGSFEDTGNKTAMSTSWFTDAGTSDDYLIMPLLEIPETAEWILRWKARSVSDTYKEFYQVYIQEGDCQTADDFTDEAVFYTFENNEWTTRNIDLSVYKGKKIRIAFRNHTNDGYAIAIDDLQILENPIVKEIARWDFMDGKLPEGSITWDIDQATVAEVLREEVGFDEKDSWKVFTYETGDFAQNPQAISAGILDPEGTNDDWLILPPVEVPESGLTTLEWVARSNAANAVVADRYEVYIYEGEPQKPEDFGQAIFTEEQATIEFNRQIVKLNTYKGKRIRIAFRNNSTKGYGIALDNILVQNDANGDDGTYQTVFNYDFSDNKIPDSFILIDGDNQEPTILQANRGFSQGVAWIYYPGTGSAASTSQYYTTEPADDWMILPETEIPTSEKVLLRWRASSNDMHWKDGYEVYVQEGNPTTISAFTSTPVFSIREEAYAWTERTVDLTAYAGKRVRIAFRNNSTDCANLFIDDIALLHKGNSAIIETIHVEKAGTLSNLIKSQESELTRVKITGHINEDDLFYLSSNVIQYYGKLKEVDLSEVEIKDNTLPDLVFMDAIPLQKINLPRDLKVGINAFGRCSTLQYVSFEENLVSVGESAFGFCTSLTEIELKGTQSNYQVNNLALTTADGKKIIAFTSGNKLAEYHVADGVVEIGWASFTGADIKEIVLSSSVSRIADYAFDGLKSDKVELNDGLVEIGNKAFFEASIGDIEIPASVNYLGNDVFMGCPVLTVSFAPRDESSELQMGVQVFSESGLKQISLPEGIRTLPSATFTASKNLTEIILPKSLEEIGDYALSETGISEIIIPDQVKNLGCNALYNCPSLKQIYLGESVKMIAEIGIAECPLLELVESRNPEPPVLGEDVFYNSNVKNCTLKVPENSIEKYKNAEQWKDFGRFESTGSSIATEKYNTGTQIFANNGTIQITLPEKGKVYCLFNPTGILIATAKAENNDITFQVHDRGLYLIKCENGKTYKVIF